MSNKPQLHLRLLGAPEIQVGGEPLSLNHLKARALLFYLAATAQPHTRDHLTALLWNESPAAEARHSLRSAIYRLRQALRPSGTDSALIVNGDLLQLQINDPVEGCDVTQFDTLINQGSESALTQAIFLYRGRFLQGFTLPDAPGFEEWARFEETRLHQTYLDALSHLAGWAEGRADWAAAIGYVQQIVQADPLNEAGQRQLMELYLRSGSIGLALRQYQRFEATLRQELGLAPAPETQALFQSLLHHPATPASHPESSAPMRRPQTLPFVGRESLIAELVGLSQAVTEGQGTVILLQGEGGLGKSRLLAELVGQLVAHPVAQGEWLILQGTCSPFDERLSYGPFVDAFQTALPSVASDLADLLSDSYEAAPDARGQFFWRVLQAIRMQARAGPLLLTIDDLQWANSATLNLFGFLALRLRGLPVLLVGTAQRIESIPALTRLVTLGRRRGDLRLYPLAPLAPESVQALLDISNVAATAPLAEWLHGQSGGNPFLLEEILAQMRADAVLTPVSEGSRRADAVLTPINEGWRLDTTRWLRWRAAFTLPETTHDLVAWRLANLSAEARLVLEVLAVAGRPLPFALLAEFPGVAAGPLVGILDDLVTRRLVVEAANDSYALPHHLLREALRHRLSNLRLRTLHRQLAEALEANPRYQTEAPGREIAVHAVAGEDVERARRYGLQVLADLPQAYAGAETANFVQHLYDLLSATASASEQLRLTYTLGRLHQALGHLTLAAHWQQQSLDLARDSGDRVAEASTHFEMGELALVTNDYQAAQAAAQAGLAVCTASASTPMELTGRGHRLLGAALAMEGSDLPAAEDHLQQAVSAHRRADNLGDLCATLFELGNVAAQRGDILRALAFYQESARAAEAGQVHYFQALAHNNLAYHSLLLGRPQPAQESITQGLRLAETYEMLGVLLYLYSTQGELHLYRGEWAAATDSFERGLALAEELGHLERQAGYRAGLALAARGRGEIQRTLTLLEEALTLITGQGYWHLRTRILLWLAETLIQADRASEARPHLESALATAQAHQRALLLTQAQRLQAQLLALEGDWPGAQTLFAAALESAQGLGRPLEVARTQAAWGMAARRFSAEPDRGEALLLAARETFVACDVRAELLPQTQIE